MSHSYSTGDKSLSNFIGHAVNNPRQNDRNQDSTTTLANQGVVTQLSEQISSLNDRMDEFTSRVEELNSKLTIKNNSDSQQNMVPQAEPYNGSASTTHFISGLGNGSLTGSIMRNSSSSSQLAKESSLMEEIQVISLGQRQIMLQLDNLGSLLREKAGERARHVSRDGKRIMADVEQFRVPLIITLAIGGLGIFLLKGCIPRN